MGAALESAVHDTERAAAAPRMVWLRARPCGHRGGAFRHGHAPRRIIANCQRRGRSMRMAASCLSSHSTLCVERRLLAAPRRNWTRSVRHAAFHAERGTRIKIGNKNLMQYELFVETRPEQPLVTFRLLNADGDYIASRDISVTQISRRNVLHQDDRYFA